MLPGSLSFSDGSLSIAALRPTIGAVHSTMPLTVGSELYINYSYIDNYRRHTAFPPLRQGLLMTIFVLTKPE